MDHVTYFWNFGTPSICRERFPMGTRRRINVEK